MSILLVALSLKKPHQGSVNEVLYCIVNVVLKTLVGQQCLTIME